MVIIKISTHLPWTFKYMSLGVSMGGLALLSVQVKNHLSIRRYLDKYE